MSRHRCKFLIGLAALISAAGAFAHNAPGSAVLLDFHADRVEAELRLPLSELALSFKQPLETDPATIVTRYRAQLADYVRQHLAVRSPDDRAWTIAVGEMHVALTEQPIDLVVQLKLQPPRGAPTRRFTLHDDLIVHEVINHITFVFVRHDWNHAVFPDRPELLAPLRFFAKTLAIDRTGGSPWIGLRSRLIAGGDYLAAHTQAALATLLLPLLLLLAWHQAAQAIRTARPPHAPSDPISPTSL